MKHAVLLGDSIFDNSKYTASEPDVVEHLRDLLPEGWTASSLAVDGSVSADIAAQAARLPAGATHLVLSAGGNDALLCADLLDAPVASTAEALELFGDRIADFEEAYRAAVDDLIAMGKPLTVCTVYDANLGPAEASRAGVALRIFNDVILRSAFERRLPVIDLRLVCTEPQDYANDIEPSGRGGLKIATAIARAIGAISGQEVCKVWSAS